MSKAFTRESDQSGAEEMTSFRHQLPPGIRNYITRDGAERLKQQLHELIARKQALAGTSSELGQAGEAGRREIESAIRKLQQKLDSVVVAEIPAEQEKVAFGATVTVRHESGEAEAYRIVGFEEANPESGWISWLSPLARALLSRRAGEKVHFRSPAGAEELTIVAVRYSD